MNVTTFAKALWRRAALVALTLVLLLGLMVVATGCSDAEKAIQEKQAEEAEQFEEDILESAGGASGAQDAVEDINAQVEGAEDAMGE